MASDQINLEFLQELKSKGEKSVIYFFIDMKLIASGFECQTCKSPMTLCEQSDDSFWSCPVHGGTNDYRHRQSVRSGSWFEGTKAPLIDMLICIYLWVTETVFIRISEELEVSEKALQRWIQKFRDACVEILLNESVILGGPGVIVEICDAKVLIKKPSKARITSEWVFLVAERGTNKCFAHVNENRDKTVLLNILLTRVLPGTTIICECWNTYCSFEEKVNLGVNNNLSIMDVDPDRSESFWTLIENTLYGRTSSYEFDCNVAEFMWRHFHQRDYEALFRSFLKHISCKNCA